ncbi:MAG: 2-oxoglutarate synthase [Deltaproteobacteria bacterium]|nr:2-oxoglutarate synthase [Deltaproteobacteria bacterium]
MNDRVPEHPLRKYLRPSVKGTGFCPGCGDGTVLQCILRAIDELKMEMDDFVFVSGIGCAAWIISPYFNGDVLHTTHGRPIAFATGIKLNLPEKKVMVISGDGDLTAIGGNHLIHAARRNIEMVVVCVNNGIYGMTGGQVAPTTPRGARTITTPLGNLENAFDIAPMVRAAGASYVARWTTFHPRRLTRSIKRAIGKKGFAFVEAVSQCPVQFGAKTGAGSAVEMFEMFKEKSISVEKASAMKPEELGDRIVVGEFADRDRPELCEEILRLKRGAGRGP